MLYCLCSLPCLNVVSPITSGFTEHSKSIQGRLCIGFWTWNPNWRFWNSTHFSANQTWKESLNRNTTRPIFTQEWSTRFTMREHFRVAMKSKLGIYFLPKLAHKCLGCRVDWEHRSRQKYSHAADINHCSSSFPKDSWKNCLQKVPIAPELLCILIFEN